MSNKPEKACICHCHFDEHDDLRCKCITNCKHCNPEKAFIESRMNDIKENAASMNNQPIFQPPHSESTGEWKEKLRDLYLISTPDTENLHTKIISFQWGKFEFDPKSPKCEFYLQTRDAIEEFIESLLHSQRQEAVQQERARNIETIKKSRTIDESYGIGIREETARTQAIADILSSPQE